MMKERVKMSDLVPRKDRDLENVYVPRETLVKQGITAVGSLAGALVLFIIKHLPFIAGVIVGGLVALFGLLCLTSKDREDRKAGLFLCVAGGLALLSRSPFLPGLSGGLLSLGIFGLLGLGIWKGIKFLRGIKARG
jgi:hypothetical protein